MPISQEDKLQKELSRYKAALKQEKAKTKSLSGKLATSKSKHVRLQQENTSLKKENITLKKRSCCGNFSKENIERHKFPELIVSLSVQLYMTSGCGFRKVVEMLSLLNRLLGWELSELPCRNSIENWVKKSGYAAYTTPGLKESHSEYAQIIDESMMVGSERLLLTLGMAAEKRDKGALDFSQMDILDISVRNRWDSCGIEQVLRKVEHSLKRDPKYIIGDNETKLAKAICLMDYTHILDISHTLAMFLERTYKKEPEFLAFTKDLSLLRFSQIMNSTAYLLPPKQRTLARFMNLSGVLKWAISMRENFLKLSTKERSLFTCIDQHAGFIDELSQVLECVNRIGEEIKANGLAPDTVKTSINYVMEYLSKGNARMIHLAALIIEYLKSQQNKLVNQQERWHASSDIVESTFGIYKARKSPNTLCGVTSFVLFLPLLTRLKDTSKEFDFKTALQKVSLAKIKTWEKENLTESLMVKRKNILTA